MIEILIACALFTAPIWGNIYLLLQNGIDGFVAESLACAILSILIFIACVYNTYSVFDIPLRSSAHTILAFGTTFSAVDIHRGDVWFRLCIILGFHAALFAVFLWDKQPNKRPADLPSKLGA